MKNLIRRKIKPANITIISRILISFFLIIMGSMGWMMVRYLDNHGRKTTVAALETILQSTHNAVSLWILEHMDELEKWALSPKFLSSVEEQLKREQNQELLENSPALLNMREILREEMDSHYFNSFFVISKNYINIGAIHDSDIGKENLIFVQRKKLMEEVFQGNTKFIPPVFREIPQPDYTEGLVHYFTTEMFIAIPIKDKTGQVAAVLAIGMNTSRGLSSLAQSGRIGESGDVYFFDQAGRLITESRFESELRDIGLLKSGQSSILNLEIRDPRGSMLEGLKPLTLMAQSATEGHNGVSIEAYNDYRGVPVLGAWLWDNTLGIGMANEIDIEEALGPIIRSELFFLVIFGITLLFSFVFSLIMIQIRRTGEGLLRQSEARLSEAQRIGSLGNWDWDIVEEKLYWSDEIYRIFGLKPQEFGASYEAFIKFVHSEDRETVQKAVEECLQTKQPYSIDHRIIREDGMERFVHEQGEIYSDDAGQPIRLIGTVQDITERKGIEKELQLYQENLEDLVEKRTIELKEAKDSITREKNISESLINSLPGLFFLIDQDESFIRYNKNFQVITEYSKQEMKQIKALDLFDKDRELIETKIQEVLTIGQGEVEADLMTKSGRIIPFLFTVTKIDIYGHPCLIGTAADMTKLRQAGNELKKLSLAVEQSPNTIVITDSKGTIEFVNSAFLQMTGYSSEEVIGKTPQILKSGKMSDALYRELWSTIKKGNVWKGEMINKTKSGELLWEWMTVSPIKDRSGQISHFLAIQENITERKDLEENLKDSEERYRALFEQAGDSILLGDLETGQIVEFNDEACKHLGYSREEFEKLDISQIDVADSPQEISAHPERILTRGFDSFETKQRHKNGELRDVWVNTRIISIAGKQYLQSICRDITELKKLEEELIMAKDKAESSVQAKSYFLANMSHEIRTPMNSIIGFIDIVLEKNNITGKTRDHLKTARNSANSLLTLINDILDLSKLEAEKLEIEKQKFHLQHLLKDTLQTLNLSAIEKGLDLTLDLQPSLYLCIIGDKNRLHQVLINLIGNAIKFTNEGSVIVSVKDNENGFLLFSVKDTGIGMTSDQLKNIFQPFSQADQSTARRFGGTGLGTSISKQMVTLMGGDIWVESEIGKGSTFNFTFPLSFPDSAEECYPESEEHGQSGEINLFRSTRSYRILIAEDIEENAALAHIRLSQQGHEVLIVKNGSEAVRTFQDKSFDLILMDVQMPVMDGLEATREIRKLEMDTGKRIPIIALTASIMQEDRQKYHEVGMDEAVGKPIQFDELFTVMEKIVPEGIGLPITNLNIDQESPAEWIFPTDLKGIDIETGIRTWQDKMVYAKALRDFAFKYGNASQRLNNLIDEEKTDDAIELSHILKGVSGNMSIIEVEKLAVKIDMALKNGNPEEAAKWLPELTSALNTAVISIEHIQLPVEEAVSEAGSLNFEETDKLIKELMFLFNRGEFSEELLSDLLGEIRGYVQNELLEKLKYSIENFDFDSSAEALKLITDSLVNKE